MAKSANLKEMFIIKLQALYDIENVILKALPKMIEKSTDRELKGALSSHLEETSVHVDRLESAFLAMDEKPKKLKCEGIRGIVDDAEWTIKNTRAATGIDAGIAASAAYVEHYEMAGYGTAVEWAKILDYGDIADLLEETLNEERSAADTVNSLAVNKLNQEALGSDENTEDDKMETEEVDDDDE